MKYVKIIIVMIAVVLTCHGCQANINYSKNFEIDELLRQEAHTLVDSLFSAASAKDVKTMKSLLSNEYYANGFSEQNAIDFLGLYGDQFPKLYFECLFVTDRVSQHYQKYEFEKDSAYYLSIALNMERVYMLFYTCETEKGSQIVSILLVENEGHLKLLNANHARFDYNGMSIQQLVLKANVTANNYPLSAYVYYELATSLSRPFDYLIYDEIVELEKQTITARKAVAGIFPIALNTEVGNVAISSLVFSADSTQGLVPTLICETDANIQNAAVVQTLGQAIVDELDQDYLDGESELVFQIHWIESNK